MAPSKNAPIVPFCRKQHHADVMKFRVEDPSDGDGVWSDRIIVFGGKAKLGHNEPIMMNDMWTLHVTNNAFKWRQLHPPSPLPLPRWKYGGAVATSNDTTGYVIYGGDCETNGVSAFLDDLWEYSPSSEMNGEGTWTELKGRGHKPDQRRGHAQVFTRNGTLLLQGGKVLQSGADSSPDLYALEMSDPSAKWKARAPLPAASRWGHTLTYVQSEGLEKHIGLDEAAVLYGGRRYDTALDDFVYYPELWAYSPSEDSWQILMPALDEDGNATPEPQARDHHSAAYVRELDTLFVFAGRYSELLVPPLNDVWGFSFTDLRWRKADVRGDTPLVRFGHDTVVWRGGAGDGDPALVTFGGETISRWGKDSLLNDVWLFDPKSTSWRQVSRSDCNPGATGEIAVPFVDIEAFLVLTAIVVVVGIALCAIHVWRAVKAPRGSYTRVP